MATVTRTPEEQLALALDRIDVAKANLAQRRQEELDARAKADQTRGLVAAAQRQWKNAEARYRVLAESAQLVGENVAQLEAAYALTKATHDAAEAEARHAEALHTLLGEALAAAEAALGANEAWVAEASSVVASIGTATEAVAGATTDQKGKRAATSLRSQQTGLTKRLGELGRGTELKDAIDKINKALRRAPDPAPLRAEEERLDAELAAARETVNKARVGPSPGDVDDAREEFEAAEKALVEVPEAQRRAESDLRAARESLDQAKSDVEVAVGELDVATRQFVERVDVTASTTGDAAIAAAVLKRDIPPGYQLRWTVEAGSLKTDVGRQVSIDTAGLPPGAYDVTVRIERI